MIQFLKACIKWQKTWHTMPVFDWVKAANLYKKGQYYHAAKLYKKGMESHSHHIAFKSAQNDYLICLMKTGEYLLCASYLERLVSDDNCEQKYLLQLASIYLRFGEVKKRQELLIKCVQKYGIDEFNIAQIIHSSIDAGEINYFSSKLRLSLGKIKKNIFINTAISRWNYQLNMSAANRATIANLAAQSNAPLEAQLIYADILRQEDRYDYARKHYVKAMVIAPRDPRPYIGNAKCLLYLGLEHHINSALGMALEAVRLSCWKNHMALQILAECYVKTGDKITALMVADLAVTASKREQNQVSEELTLLYNSLSQENM